MKKRPKNKPKGLNDPVADLTEWTVLTGRRGSNIRTHKFIERDDLIVVKPIRITVILGILVLVLPLSFWTYLISIQWEMIQGLHFIFKVLFVMGPIAFLWIPIMAGTAMLDTSWNTIIEFDKQQKTFTKDRKIPLLYRLRELLEWYEQRPYYLKWEEIHAIQIIKKVRADKSLTSYEMNLVTKKGERINLTDHSHLETILDDASKINQLLNIPIWMEGSSGLSMLKNEE